MTCNPKWPEVVRFLEERGLRSEDRLDILCRVFKMKLDRMIKDLKDNMIFGKVDAKITLSIEQLKNFALIEIDKLL
ncbi:hypothetical protein ACS0TY_003558 [Phlomoides rotata]